MQRGRFAQISSSAGAVEYPYGYLAGLMGGHIAGRWKSWNLQKPDVAKQGSFVHRRTPLSVLSALRGELSGE